MQLVGKISVAMLKWHGRFVQAPETQREASHWDGGIVRSSWRHEEVGHFCPPLESSPSNNNAAAADRLLVDILYGYDVVRPDFGALINISATMMAAGQAGQEGWPQQDYPPAVETKHGKK
jgi:hypothetical protein